jgi:hypothetical protein
VTLTRLRSLWPSAADITLISTGSEVAIVVEAVEVLAKQNIKARVVSLPCWEVFEAQPVAYKLSVIPSGAPVMSVEAYNTFGESRTCFRSAWTGGGANSDLINISSFGFLLRRLVEVLARALRSRRIRSFGTLHQGLRPLRDEPRRSLVAGQEGCRVRPFDFASLFLP